MVSMPIRFSDCSHERRMCSAEKSQRFGESKREENFRKENKLGMQVGTSRLRRPRRAKRRNSGVIHIAGVIVPPATARAGTSQARCPYPIPHTCLSKLLRQAAAVEKI